MRSAHSAQSTRLSIAWCAWALLFAGLAVEFDLSASPYFACLLIAEALLAWRSYRVTGIRYFLALCFLPALPALVLALPARARPDTLRLMALTIPPLIALGVVALLATDRLHRSSVLRRVLMIAALAVVGLGVGTVARPFGAPALDTPAGRALVAGCYHVTRGLALPYWSNREWPPAFARFDTARWVARDERNQRERDEWNSHLGGPYWGEAMIQSPGGTPGWWRVRGPRTISIDWTHAGLGGFRGHFRLAGEDLVGAGEWFQDLVLPFPLPPRILAVRLHRIVCGEMR